MVTRIAKLKNKNGLLMGMDLNNVFKDGHVYDVKECLGQIIFTDLGEHALLDNYDLRAIEVVVEKGIHCISKEEYKKNNQQNLNKL